MGLQPTYGTEKHNRRGFIDSKQVTEYFSTEYPVCRELVRKSEFGIGPTVTVGLYFRTDNS